MLIRFEVGEHQAEFRWSPWSGRTTLMVGPETVALQSPLNPGAHFSLGLSQLWISGAFGHRIEILKRRPQLLAGFRDNEFTVCVDGVTVVRKVGR